MQTFYIKSFDIMHTPAKPWLHKFWLALSCLVMRSWSKCRSCSGPEFIANYPVINHRQLLFCTGVWCYIVVLLNHSQFIHIGAVLLVASFIYVIISVVLILTYSVFNCYLSCNTSQFYFIMLFIGFTCISVLDLVLFIRLYVILCSAG